MCKALWLRSSGSNCTSPLMVEGLRGPGPATWTPQAWEVGTAARLQPALLQLLAPCPGTLCHPATTMPFLPSRLHHPGHMRATDPEHM